MESRRSFALDKKSPEPLYEQVKKYIIDGINRSLFNPHQKVHSEWELSSRFGISRSTVRKALDDLCHQGILFKIQGKGTFAEDPRNLKKSPLIKGKPSIGVVVLLLRDPLISQIVVGIEETLYKSGFQLIFSHSDRHEAVEEEKIKTLRKDGVEGIILYPADREVDNRTLRKLREDRFPIIFVDRYLEGYEISSIISDNYGGGYKITEHFIKHGYSKIGFFAPPHAGITSVVARFGGYCQALKDYGIAVKDSLAENPIDVSVPDDSLANWAKYRRRIERYLKENKGIEAVFVYNDYCATGFYSVCHAMGIRISQDLAIAGFDDVGASNLIPPLTTVHQDGYEMGRRAAEMILQMIKGGECQERQIIVPIELKIRKSCGC